MKRKLQMTNRNQFVLTIPKSICELSGLKGGEELDFSIKDNEITIKRVKL